ncbi:GNAT family N-acetyltransferase [Streptomyces sp. Je 1-369]|uniref:GNAT family N-acetyltransferase n=1 Tax=Streptomyces sp. Je 1-369 TaxID=2966192 RepID=UPI0022867FFC|nr:GNAT family protein [Streptomyces sp. Je 1-369]WAL97655.1 GNAT family N-acetyltransferase [Streptomyces sp. Je 1-369]
MTSSPATLSLRPWRQEDAEAVLTAFGTPEMTRQADEPVDSPAAAADWITRRTRDRDLDRAYAFAVTDENGTPLGNVAVGAVNRTHATGWVSYWTTPAARGRGVAAYGCAALARWCFDELALHRLELAHRTNNPASCAVAHAAGFAVEGLQRQKLAYDGVRYDVELHARLASDVVPGTYL